MGTVVMWKPCFVRYDSQERSWNVHEVSSEVNNDGGALSVMTRLVACGPTLELALAEAERMRGYPMFLKLDTITR